MKIFNKNTIGIASIAILFCSCKTDYSKQVKSIQLLKDSIQVLKKEVSTLDTVKINTTLSKIIERKEIYNSIDSSKISKTLYIQFSDLSCLENSLFKYNRDLPKTVNKLDYTIKQLSTLEKDLKEDLLPKDARLDTISKQQLVDIYIQEERDNAFKVKNRFIKKRVVKIDGCIDLYERKEKAIDSLLSSLR